LQPIGKGCPIPGIASVEGDIDPYLDVGVRRGQSHELMDLGSISSDIADAVIEGQLHR
jgi:hypothetical protein